jgi:hypothetical protein
MFQVFQMVQRYVVIVSYGCYKIRSGMLRMLHMLQVFQRFVQNISSVADVCCKRSDLDVAYVSHICCSNML